MKASQRSETTTGRSWRRTVRYGAAAPRTLAHFHSRASLAWLASLARSRASLPLPLARLAPLPLRLCRRRRRRRRRRRLRRLRRRSRRLARRWVNSRAAVSLAAAAFDVPTVRLRLYLPWHFTSFYGCFRLTTTSTVRSSFLLVRSVASASGCCCRIRRPVGASRSLRTLCRRWYTSRWRCPGRCP